MTLGPPYYLSPGQVHTAQISALLSGYSIRFTDAFFLSDMQEQTQLAELPLFYLLDVAPLIPAIRHQAASISALLRTIEQEYHSELKAFCSILPTGNKLRKDYGVRSRPCRARSGEDG